VPVGSNGQWTAISRPQQLVDKQANANAAALLLPPLLMIVRHCCCCAATVLTNVAGGALGVLQSPVEAYLDQLLSEVREDATAAGFKARVSGWGERPTDVEGFVFALLRSKFRLYRPHVCNRCVFILGYGCHVNCGKK
jgi:hypothetical protein